MGGAVSMGIDNNDLTDNLREVAYIRTNLVDRVFRAVDRGEYILPEYRMNAYKDQAWRCNHLHLSAPCIYSEVMEALCLAPGLSFLNMGSGTGYLSTMAGLILGSNGINHGIEYYDDVITYAHKKLDDFKRYSGAIDEFDFCEPKFMQGNCLCLTNERRYDRIYVGAACPESYDDYVKQLLTVGGILVMPYNEQLLQIKRTHEFMWNGSSLLSVSFANLIMPQPDNREPLELIPIDPAPLQELCRSKIRNILRHNIEVELPDLPKSSTTVITPTAQTAAAEKRRAANPYVKNALCVTNDTEREQDVRHYLGLVFDRVVDERSARLNGRRINCLNWFTELGYEEEMETSNQNVGADVETNETESSADKEELMETTSGENVESTSAERKTDDDDDEEKQTRQKFDSGLGEESHSDDMCMFNDNDDVEDEEEEDDDETKKQENKRAKTYAWHVYEGDTSTSDCEDSEDLVTPDLYQRRTVASPYTQHMQNKIQQLPLPNILKDYLNFYRN